MINFKGVVTLLGVKESEWTNPDSGQTVRFHDIVAYVNTGFKSGPQSYVYHMKLNSKMKDFLSTVKSWEKGTQISVAGLVTSVDKPSKSDPTSMWTNMGLLLSEISPAMVSQPVPKEYEKAPLPPEQVAKLEANGMEQFDDIPF